jgi:hypothetical protein
VRHKTEITFRHPWPGQAHYSRFDGTVLSNPPGYGGAGMNRATLHVDCYVGIDRSRTLQDEPGRGHNRWHPDIPSIARVEPGAVIGIETRDACDLPTLTCAWSSLKRDTNA